MVGFMTNRHQQGAIFGSDELIRVQIEFLMIGKVRTLINSYNWCYALFFFFVFQFQSLRMVMATEPFVLCSRLIVGAIFIYSPSFHVVFFFFSLGLKAILARSLVGSESQKLFLVLPSHDKKKWKADPKSVDDGGRGQGKRTHLPIKNGCSHNTRITSENERRSWRKLNSIL